VAGSYEPNNETSASIKGVEFLDQLSKYKLIKNDCFIKLMEWKI
jgi:hypothetical protein